ncbi:MAG: hypothetical protein ACTSVZ_00075, partial [Promethearchaeota archaeon]
GYDYETVRTRADYQNFQFFDNSINPATDQYYMPPPCYNPMAPNGQETSPFWVKRVKFYYYNRLHANDFQTHRPNLATVGGFHLDSSSQNFQIQGPGIIWDAQEQGITWAQLMTANLSNWGEDTTGNGQLIHPSSSPEVNNWMAIQVFETLRIMISEQMGDLPIAVVYDLMANLYGFTDLAFWIWEFDGEGNRLPVPIGITNFGPYKVGNKITGGLGYQFYTGPIIYMP